MDLVNLGGWWWGSEIGVNYHPPEIYAVNSELFWEYLRYAVTIFSSETIIFFMQFHLPCFSWDSSQYAFAAFKHLGFFFLQLQCWRFSELISHNLLGGWKGRALKHPPILFQECDGLSNVNQKSLGVHKFLSEKFGFTPPRKGPKMRKN